MDIILDAIFSVFIVYVMLSLWGDLDKRLDGLEAQLSLMEHRQAKEKR